MNKTINGLLMFVGGAAVGAVITWKLVKDHYARNAQIEIDSVKEVFSKKFAEDVAKEEEKKEEKPQISTRKPSLEEYAKRLNDLGYTSYHDEEGDAEEEPEIITPDEFGELDYETVYLSYYADKVLADELDDAVEDIQSTIGLNALLHIGDYEQDVVHVRNHTLRRDYEVTLDSREFYTDIKGVSPDEE